MTRSSRSLTIPIPLPLNRSFIRSFIHSFVHRPPQVYLRDVLSRMVLMMSSSKGGKNPVVLVQKFVENQLLLNDVPFTFRVWTTIGGGRCRYPDDARRHHAPPSEAAHLRSHEHRLAGWNTSRAYAFDGRYALRSSAGIAGRRRRAHASRRPRFAHLCPQPVPSQHRAPGRQEVRIECTSGRQVGILNRPTTCPPPFVTRFLTPTSHP